jgi:hypothetical protein
MVIVNQTPITEKSFTKWKAHKIDVDDEAVQYSYYVIPLVQVDEVNAESLETVPALFSSYSDEFIDDKKESVYTVRFDTQLPDMTTEEEVEILYHILTKKEIGIETLGK